MEEEIENFNKSVNEICELTEIQKDFLKEVHYYKITKGEYIFIKNYVTSRYENVIEPEGMIDEIDKLIKIGFLEKNNTRKIITDSSGNKKWVTEVLFEIKKPDCTVLPKLSLTEGLIDMLNILRYKNPTTGVILLYDKNNNLIYEEDCGYWWKWEYDEDGNRTCCVNSDGEIINN